MLKGLWTGPVRHETLHGGLTMCLSQFQHLCGFWNLLWQPLTFHCLSFQCFDAMYVCYQFIFLELFWIHACLTTFHFAKHPVYIIATWCESYIMLFCSPQTTENTAAYKKNPIRNQPWIAAFLDESRSKYVVVCETKRFCKVSSLQSALFAAFSLYLEYPDAAKWIYQFFQDFILEQPDRSEKTATYLTVTYQLSSAN